VPGTTVSAGRTQRCGILSMVISSLICPKTEPIMADSCCRNRRSADGVPGAGSRSISKLEDIHDIMLLE
jgi:hypothetical protein